MATEAQKILRTLYDAGCTDGEMAEASGIHRVTVCKIRNGQLSGDRSLPALLDLVHEVGPELGLDLPPLQQPDQGQRGSSPRATQPRPRSSSAAPARAAEEEEEAGSGAALPLIGAGAAGAVVGFLAGMWYYAARLASSL